MKNEEHLEQCAFFDWLRLACPAIYEVTFAIPNGGKRDIRTATKLKKEGVKPGVPDIFIAHPIFNKCCGSFIEMKSKTGKLSETQKYMIKLLTKDDNYYVFVAYGWEKARDFVMAHYWDRCHTLKSLAKALNLTKANNL